METRKIRLDVEKLREITNASNTAAVTMMFLALRQRSRGYSMLSSTRKKLIGLGEQVVEADYDRFWKDLQGMGIGALAFTRRGRPERFYWHYSLKAVAKAAIEGKFIAKTSMPALQALTRASESIKTTKEPKVPDQKLQPKVEEVKEIPVVMGLTRVEQRVLYTIPLRKGVVAEVTIPRDITVADIEKIKKALSR